MLKQPLIAVLSLALVLAACQAATPQASTPTFTPVSAAPTVVEEKTPAPTSSGAQMACTVVSQQPTPGPTVQSLFPPVGEQDWVRGAENAFVTIMEYSDFQCPSCAGIEPILSRLEQEHPDDLRVVYRHFPLVSIHDKAAIASVAAEAAGAQGSFWPMHDLLFERQAEWSGLSIDLFKDWVTARAGELGLDKDAFTTDLNSDANAAKAQEAWERNQAIGLPGTPFLLFNGQPYQGPLNYANISTVVNLILLEKKQFTTCPPVVIDQARQYFATLQTVKGDIVLELYANKTPLAVDNFVFLAENGWFDGVTFHRVLPGYIAQAGDPTASGFGGPGYTFDNEVSPDLKFDKAGILGMANAGPGSNGSQFFITMAPTPNLDGGYTIFGQVVSGMDVVQQLTPRDPSQNMNLPAGDEIQKVTIEEK